MTTAELRRRIKKAIDNVPQERLEGLADYVEYLSRRPTLLERIEEGRKSIASGKGIDWRKVRSDV